MNVTLDFKFGSYVIPQKLILHTSKFFFTMVPPNPVSKGRNNKNVLFIRCFNLL